MNLKTRSDLIDYDYIDKLSDKDKEWLNKFTEEYVHDSLDRKNLRKNLHNTQKLKKDCDDRNNARNRCILTRSKAQGLLTDIDDLKRTLDRDKEDDLVEELDNLNNTRTNSNDDGQSSQ